MRCMNVLIADRCPVVVHGLKKVLGAQHNFKLVACCSDGMSCIEAIRSLRPDIAILDISMPGLTGLEILSIVISEVAHLLKTASWSSQPRAVLTASF